jgi:hypothetical protein
MKSSASRMLRPLSMTIATPLVRGFFVLSGIIGKWIFSIGLVLSIDSVSKTDKTGKNAKDVFRGILQLYP